MIAGYGRPNWKLAADEAADDDFQMADTSSDEYLNALASIVGAKPVASTNTNTADVKPVIGNSSANTNVESHGWKPGTLKQNPKYSVNVMVLQSLLTARGFNCGKIDGYFGALTEVAVNHAKRYYDLERNGECDYALWVKLLLIER